jgi:hypothetical protein
MDQKAISGPGMYMTMYMMGSEKIFFSKPGSNPWPHWDLRLRDY